MANGLNAMNAGREFGEHPKISKDHRAKSFSVLAHAIARGKTKIDAVEKMLPIG